ncbi:hypothetical protein E1J28_20360 [Xanthomonas hortorum pv. vitians]|uniref:hypothetical protein n=1 Tax=Xanthomonas hortorum TaxID=56454 RepID=UPI00182E6858|nr:hypothetical protein [Xanthomonas hortorum]MCE4344080.1 hypothetical protein [Xanthomonas hortorum pv. vitians]NMI19794.1 hypothetical protein [Xanthomonas hortorum pv. vitians]
MLNRLKHWWSQRRPPRPMAPEQMQALVEINLLEIQLATLDSLRTQAASDETVSPRTHAWLATVRRHGLRVSRDWAKLKAEARALNRELAPILDAATPRSFSESPNELKHLPPPKDRPDANDRRRLAPGRDQRHH